MDVDEMPAFFQCVHVLARKACGFHGLTRTERAQLSSRLKSLAWMGAHHPSIMRYALTVMQMSFNSAVYNYERNETMLSDKPFKRKTMVTHYEQEIVDVEPAIGYDPDLVYLLTGGRRGARR